MGTAGPEAVQVVPEEPPTGPDVALLFHDAGTEVDQFVRQGFDRAVTDFDLTPRIRSTSSAGAASELQRLSRLDPDVVLVATIQTDVDSVARDHPDVQ